MTADEVIFWLQLMMPQERAEVREWLTHHKEQA